MISFRQPSDDAIRGYVAQRQAADFSYDCVGCTREISPRRRGWTVDHHRVLLGHGGDAFARARAAIDQWRMFPPTMTTLCWPQPPQAGATVAVVYRASLAPVWLLFAARVVYTVDSPATDGRGSASYGFAYGTLPDHPERGEERFLAQWNRVDDSVWYDLRAVSQPAQWLVRFGFPYTRFEQARFRRLSGLAMQQAVNVCGELFGQAGKHGARGERGT